MPGATGPRLTWLRGRVATWIEGQLYGWSADAIHHPKVVRDPIHGFVWLEPHEVALLDLPILQRLRFIHQTGMTYLVYPGANHSRLEHSVGVLEVSQKMLDSLKRRRPIRETDRVHVRLAALLHDVGHVLFSHLGEETLKRLFPRQIHALNEESFDGERRLFSGVPLGEVFSYAIVTSRPFQDAFERIRRRNPRTARGHSIETLDLGRAARMIIGKPNREEPRWAADIINGSFDADKLDYLMRDCHYTGVRAEVDTSRLVHSLDVVKSSDWNGSLGVAGVSVNYLEQILLAKLTLYTAVYHHHKIRSIECMFNGFFEEASEAGVRHYTIPRNLFDLFDVSEAQFLSAAPEVRKAGELVSALQKRRLPKRSLIIDSTTVRREDRPGLLALVDDLRSPRRQRDVRSAIREGMGNAMTDSVADVWLDIPRPPDVDEEALRCPVILSPTRVAPLSELMPAEDWVKSYVANKLRGHLFLRGSLRQRRRAATSALAFLRENYRIRLDPLARGLALKE